MDNNAAQFARKGDPWVSEKDRVELRATLLPEKGGPKPAKIRPAFADKILPTYISPEMAEKLEELDAQKFVRNYIAQHKKVGNFQIFIKPTADQPIQVRLRTDKPEPETFTPKPLPKRTAKELRITHAKTVIKELEAALAGARARLERMT